MSFVTRAIRKIRRELEPDPRLDMLARCAAGAVPVTIALMVLADGTAGRAEAENLVQKALAANKAGEAGQARLHEVEALLREHPKAHELVRGIEATLTARQPGTSETEHWAAVYDAAVKVSPEASVALYSFGDPELLGKITAELIARLLDWQVVRPDMRILDYGCGIGRVAAALAPHLDASTGGIVAVDISAEMQREARRRLSTLGNATVSSVKDFASDRTVFDLILLIDVCPYIADPAPVLAGLLPRLRSGGSLIVMNWSYDISDAAQRVAAQELAQAHGLALLRNGTAEFTLWDGLVFHFRRSA